jgi:hypothetical protein
MNTFGRNYRIEVYRPDGQLSHGTWVSGREGCGTLTDRLEHSARIVLTSEPAGSAARVFRYIPYSSEPMPEVARVTLPASQS